MSEMSSSLRSVAIKPWWRSVVVGELALGDRDCGKEFDVAIAHPRTLRKHRCLREVGRKQQVRRRRRFEHAVVHDAAVGRRGDSQVAVASAVSCDLVLDRRDQPVLDDSGRSHDRGDQLSRDHHPPVHRASDHRQANRDDRRQARRRIVLEVKEPDRARRHHARLTTVDASYELDDVVRDLGH